MTKKLSLRIALMNQEVAFSHIKWSVAGGLETYTNGGRDYSLTDFGPIGITLYGIILYGRRVFSPFPDYLSLPRDTGHKGEWHNFSLMTRNPEDVHTTHLKLMLSRSLIKKAL